MINEYERRIDLCSKAVEKATKKSKHRWGFAADYQGIEIEIETEVGEGKVIVLMDTGHGPRFPKYITLTVHGYIDHEVNKKVNIGGGGLTRSSKKFLPNEISVAWLTAAILDVAQTVKSICTTENMTKLKSEALVLRRKELKETSLAKYQTTFLKINSNK